MIDVKNTAYRQVERFCILVVQQHTSSATFKRRSVCSNRLSRIWQRRASRLSKHNSSKPASSSATTTQSKVSIGRLNNRKSTKSRIGRLRIRKSTKSQHRQAQHPQVIQSQHGMLDPTGRRRDRCSHQCPSALIWRLLLHCLETCRSEQARSCAPLCIRRFSILALMIA